MKAEERLISELLKRGHKAILADIIAKADVARLVGFCSAIAEHLYEDAYLDLLQACDLPRCELCIRLGNVVLATTEREVAAEWTPTGARTRYSMEPLCACCAAAVDKKQAKVA